MPLTAIQIEAAFRVARGDKKGDIARDSKINEATFYKWMKLPEFIAQVDEAREHYKRAIMEEGVGCQINRFSRINERWEGLERITKARSERYKKDHPQVPGIETGLLFPEYGKNGAVFKLDAPLLAEERALMVHAAKELGQWQDQSKVEVDDVSGLTDAERANRLTSLLDRARTRRDGSAAESE